MDEDDAILAGFLDVLGLIGVVVEKGRAKEATARARELGEANSVNVAVRQAVKAAQDAVMAAVIASTVAATGATSATATTGC